MNIFNKTYLKLISQDNNSFAELKNTLGNKLFIKGNISNIKEVFAKIKDKKLKSLIRFYIKSKYTPGFKTRIMNRLQQLGQEDQNVKMLAEKVGFKSKETENKKEKQTEGKEDFSPKEFLNTVFKQLQDNEKFFNYSSKLFGQDYMTETLKTYGDNKEKGIKEFEEILLDKDPQSKKTAKKFLKGCNKITKGKFLDTIKKMFKKINS